MSLATLSTREITGQYFHRLEAAIGAAWINAISNMFSSDQPVENYKWLNEVPVLREWLGGRQAKGFVVNGIDITNLHFEATLEILIRDMRRDKTGQIMARVNEFADRTISHWASLLSALVLNGESTVCYDGQFFFDTDHVEGDSGTQSNDISVDISTVPVTNHGSVTAPSVGEMSHAILQGIQQIYGFKDSRGEPLNETAQDFLVMTPVPLWHVAQQAVSNRMIDAGESNVLPNMPGVNISTAANPRLTWTDKFSVWRADSEVKSLIRQQETDVDLKVKDEDSEFAFDNDAIQLGIDTWRNVGYGRWQGSTLVTMV